MPPTVTINYDDDPAAKAAAQQVLDAQAYLETGVLPVSVVFQTINGENSTPCAHTDPAPRGPCDTLYDNGPLVPQCNFALPVHGWEIPAIGPDGARQFGLVLRKIVLNTVITGDDVRPNPPSPPENRSKLWLSFYDINGRVTEVPEINFTVPAVQNRVDPQVTLDLHSAPLVLPGRALIGGINQSLIRVRYSHSSNGGSFEAIVLSLYGTYFWRN
jgi:hypothetical protein